MEPVDLNTVVDAYEHGLHDGRGNHSYNSTFIILSGANHNTRVRAYNAYCKGWEEGRETLRWTTLLTDLTAAGYTPPTTKRETSPPATNR